MSKLMKQGNEILNKEGEAGLNRWLDALSPSQIEQLKEECIDMIAVWLGQSILASIQQSIENNLPFKGFGKN